jgi:hypothetical protein
MTVLALNSSLIVCSQPPGDANYDRVRMDLYKRSASGPASGSGSTPTTPTGAARKAALLAALQPLTIQSTPRSSFTSHSPSPTNTSASGPYSPPRASSGTGGEVSGAGAGFGRTAPSAARQSSSAATGIAIHQSNLSLTPPSQVPASASGSRMPPAGWTPASDGAAPTSSTSDAPRSRLSPTRRSIERRQMLITSLFPRASISVQDSTGIPNMQLPPAEEAHRSGAQDATSAQVHHSEHTTARTAGRYHPAHDAAQEQKSTTDSSPSQVGSSSEDDADSEASDSDDSGSYGYGDGGEEDDDAVETRTNPRVSQYSNPRYDRITGQGAAAEGEVDENCSGSSDDSGGEDPVAVEEQQAGSTSPGADDEQPMGNVLHAHHRDYQAHRHEHFAPRGSASEPTYAGAVRDSRRSEHHVPRVSAQSSHPSSGHTVAETGPTRPQRAALSESDEGGDFFENMKKFLDRFQESQLIDISDSELDGEQRLQEIAQRAAQAAMASKHTKQARSGTAEGHTKKATSKGKKTTESKTSRKGSTKARGK